MPAASTPIATPRRRYFVGISLAAAVAVLLVLSVSGWWLWPTTKPSPTSETAAATSISQPLVAPRLSIVVLPFANLSNDPDRQYFADGITEDLTTDLSLIPDMLVISANTALTYGTNRLTQSRSAASSASAMCWKGVSSDRAIKSASMLN